MLRAIRHKEFPLTWGLEGRQVLLCSDANGSYELSNLLYGNHSHHGEQSDFSGNIQNNV